MGRAAGITVEPILMSRDAGSMSLQMSQMGGVGRIDKFNPLVSLPSEMFRRYNERSYKGRQRHGADKKDTNL
jgi:hypothetical protein